MQITFAKTAAEAQKMSLEASPSELDEAQPVMRVIVSPSLRQKSSGTYSSTAVIVR
jgi:hypothetical protein